MKNEASKTSLKHRGKLLKRMWQYMGKNRVMIVLAVLLSALSSLLSLYGPKLSGQAINAITDNRTTGNTLYRILSSTLPWIFPFS